jgi:hypothetical protein
MAAQERAHCGEHPTLDEWVAYQEGSVEAGKAERLRDHLACCPECSALLLDWMAFAGPVPPEGARPIPRGEAEAAWEKLRAELPFPAGEPVAFPRRHVRTWLPQLLAAAFFLTTVGLSIQVAKLRGISAGEMIVDLHSLHDVVRSAASPEASEPLSNSETYVLSLIPDEPGEFSSYRFDIIEEGAPGKRVKSVEKPRRADGVFTLRIPAGSLDPGRYRVLLHGVQDRRAKLIDEFAFTIEKS